MGLMLLLSCLAGPVQDGQIDESKVRTLIGQLSADFLEEREKARAGLEELGKRAEPWLVAALSDPDYRIRRTCLELLVPLKSTAALKAASDLFVRDDDPSVRDAAFRLFQGLGAQAEDAMIAALASPNPEYRRGALQSLLDMKSQKGVGNVADLYDRESEKNVKDAAWKCLMSAGPAAQPHLVRYLKDSDSAVRRDALAALRGAQDEPTVTAVGKLFEQEAEEAPREQAAQFLVQVGIRAEPVFLAALGSPRPETKVASLRGLTAIKSAQALGPAGEFFLGDVPSPVRAAAAEYLGSQGLRAEPALLSGLERDVPEIRNLAITTLGKIGSEKALSTVNRLFHEVKDKDLHAKCFEFFRQVGPRAENDLLGALADEDRTIRRQAALALGDLRSERAIPRLIEFLTELDTSMKETAEIALASNGSRALDEVAQAVSAGRLKKGVAEAIAERYAEGEVERLLQMQLGEDLTTGFYENQFKDLAAFGVEKVMPILFRIMREQNFPWRRMRPGDDVSKYREGMRELAVMAVGELRGEGARAAVTAFMRDEIQNQSMRIREETLVALHRLGDSAPLEDYIRDLRKEADVALQGGAEERQKASNPLFSLGLLYHRLKRYDDAIHAYEVVLRVLGELKDKDKDVEKSYATTLYNLACEYSQSGDRAKAVEGLGKAIRAGYTDREWMMKDRDLDPIRGEEGYKKLMADDALFEKKGPDVPRADR